MKSEPLTDKKGTPASPATARANSVFPVPGGPTSKHPLRDPCTDVAKAAGGLEEIDDFADFLLDAVVAGDVSEGGPWSLGRIDLGARATDRHDPGHLSLGATVQEDEQEDQQKDWSEVDQQWLPETGARRRELEGSAGVVDRLDLGVGEVDWAGRRVARAIAQRAGDRSGVVVHRHRVDFVGSNVGAKGAPRQGWRIRTRDE